jgi:hypothetical protein
MCVIYIQQNIFTYSGTKNVKNKCMRKGGDSSLKIRNKKPVVIRNGVHTLCEVMSKAICWFSTSLKIHHIFIKVNK